MTLSPVPTKPRVETLVKFGPCTSAEIVHFNQAHPAATILPAQDCSKAARWQSGQDRWFTRIGGLEGGGNLICICRGLPIVVRSNEIARRIVQIKRGILQSIRDPETRSSLGQAP